MEKLKGEEAGMKAEKGGEAEPSSRDPDRKQKNRFSFCWQQRQNLFMFSYNEHKFEKK